MNAIRILLAIIFLNILVSPTPAAEAVGIKVDLDGKPVAGYTITYMGESEAELWLLLKQIPLTFERDFQIPIDPGDSNTATLAGLIEIRTYRRGNPGSGTTTQQLGLVRRGTDWFVADAEVDRTLKASGLKLPDKSTRPSGLGMPTAIWLVVPCVIGLIVITLLLVTARRTNDR